MTRIRGVLLACTVAVALPAAPAAAHSGGRAQLYVDIVHLEPQAGGWRAELVVRDADSGKPEPGFGVQLTATDGDRPPVGPVDLADPDADGRYMADVPLTEGTWAVTVEAAEIPGGPRAVPFTRTWPATLQPGRALDLGGSGPRAADHRAGGHLPVVPLGLALAVVAALIVGVRRYRAPWNSRVTLG